MSGNESFELLIIGTGGAGFSAAIRAHELGARRIALVEGSTIGGTCVNVGCVPSKALLAAARANHIGHRHPFDGIPHHDGRVDLAAVLRQRDHLVGQMRRSKYLDLLERYGFELLEGQARFSSPDAVEVAGRTITAARIIVATGAEPALADIDGIDAVEVLTSTTAMSLGTLPEHLIVIGAGFIGLEQAQLFRRLGARVTLVGRFAPHAEPELADQLASIFREEGITLVSQRAVRVRASHDVLVESADGVRVEGSHLLVATGRRPRTAGLGLDRAGVVLDEQGAIVVDRHQRTTNPRIYAAGDVTGSPQFVYLAAAQGAVAAEHAIVGRGSTVDLSGLPQVVFTDPQLASVGLTELAARDQGLRPEVRVLPLDQVPRAIVEHDTRGAVKIVAERSTRRVLGIHALSPAAGEVMLAATYAIRNGMTVDDLASTWAPYLTHAEAIRLTARSFDHDVEHLSCCA
ncbi:MAG: mercury(II) reductase [Acidimicrobiales bacterium]